VFFCINDVDVFPGILTEPNENVRWMHVETEKFSVIVKFTHLLEPVIDFVLRAVCAAFAQNDSQETV
jgi:hypothetical protein